MRFVLFLLIVAACGLGYLYKEERTRAQSLQVEVDRLQAEVTELRQALGGDGNGGGGGNGSAAWRQNRVDKWKSPQQEASGPFVPRDGAGSNSPSTNNSPGMNRRRYFDGSGD